MSDHEPLACSLAGAEMADRQAELRALFGGAVNEAVREGHALRLVVPDSPGLAERLERVVELERDCCPFLDLAVERHAGRLVVHVDGPPQAAPMIDGFEELVSEGRRG